MPTLPAVDGLLKWQLYFNDPPGGQYTGVVMTLWTWRNEDPVPPERVAYERDAIVAWSQSVSVRNKLPSSVASTQIKAWDMGTAPPTRVESLKILPTVGGTSDGGWAPQLGVVIALRTQPVGSTVRNRLNGRVFHPFPPVGSTSNGLNSSGQWSSTFRGEIEAAYHALRDVLEPAADPDAGQWVVPCFWEDGALRVGGPLLPAVDHVIARSYPGVRRSRMEHNGPYAVGA